MTTNPGSIPKEFHEHEVRIRQREERERDEEESRQQAQRDPANPSAIIEVCIFHLLHLLFLLKFSSSSPFLPPDRFTFH
jgi:hypothetical protein